jgi:hypothetical protein
MNQPEIDVFQQVQEYIRTKQLPKAQRLLVEYIKKNPNSEQAWYLLSTAVDDPRKQMECLQRVLRINPGNIEAQSRLMKAMGKPAVVEIPPAPAAQPIEPTPVIPITPSAPSTASGKKVMVAGRAPAAAVPPAETPPPAKPAPEPVTDTELSSLRSKMKFVKPRSPRKRGVRIILLLLLVLTAGLVGGYLMLNSLTPSQPVVEPTPEVAGVTAKPTDTPAPTGTPTVTPTPSITPTRYPPTWTPTPLPTAVPTRTPTPLPTFDPAVENALRTIQGQVSSLRDLPIDAPVPAALLPIENLEPALKSILNIQSLLPQMQNQSRALMTLGLVRPSTELTRYVLNSFADNLGGFYVPWQKVIYVLGNEFDTVELQAYAHEYEHALVDQHYRIDEMGVTPLCQIEGQQCQALRALLEGDAALVTEQRFNKYASADDKKNMAKYKSPAQALPDDTAPLFITRDVAFVFEQGRKFVDALYQRGGWAAVDQALKNLPDSTEQILHPEKYLAGEKTITVTAAPLTSTLGASWKLIASDALGEWRTYLLLSSSLDEAARLSEETAQQAAAGWGGDHYEVYLNPKTDQTLLAAQWAWDTPQDAAEFKQALSAYLDLRFRSVKAQIPDQDCWSANHQTACLYSSKSGSLLWLFGPDYPTIEQARKAYPDF